MPNKDDIVVQEEPDLDPKELWDFYVENNCCETRYPPERATSVLKKCAAVVTARDHSKLVGVARAISEGRRGSTAKIAMLK